MNAYKKVLVPLDFHSDNDQIMAKGRQMAEANDAEMYLLHVNEPMAGVYTFEAVSFGDQMEEFKDRIRSEARERLNQLAGDLGIAPERQLIREGKASREIEDVVNDFGIDLVVMGTHGHSGLQRLLGSTANSVLNHVDCDVLTVRIKE
ncbi:universal stress protein A [Ferrimonas sediminum]|uniref:Universal stress protein n=1 Tax=Ferrimonas sediminum TaxID=718193 RepID=A0A1G8TB20_9GAMM|nr:universal stress protein [Ferrimonas sediminum]SDJ38698.1 universal stress protein A [Ferrimonas sediminum]